MRLLFLLVFALLALHAQDSGQTGRYPQIRSLIREAEAAAVNVPVLDDKMRPSAWAASLYARAGYLDDAARAYGKTSEPPVLLWRARVLYGDLAGAEKDLASISDPERKANAMMSLADLLWRMGESGKARSTFEATRPIAARIADAEHRKRILTSIELGLKYSSDEPPYLLSATPAPPKKFDLQDSAIPLFPITTDGFRDLDTKEIANRAGANAEFMSNLYDRMNAGDREGLLRITERSVTPFQKTIGIASIEHILIQADQPELAEQYAKSIPEVDSDCSLAKAEALSAAGAAWLRKGDTIRAQQDFDLAASLAKAVPELPLGKVSVVVSIATAEFKGGMVASSATSFKQATELADKLPVRPEPTKVSGARPFIGIHYRDEAYNRILVAAIRAHDVGLAREIAGLWKLADGKADLAIVNAWLNADRSDEALAFARNIANINDKITALLNIAQELLNRSGAPAF